MVLAFIHVTRKIPAVQLNGPIGITFYNLLQEVDVETLDKGGFSITVHSERDCPGLLVSILEAFEELGLDVQDARVSCTDSFHLEAVGGEVSTPILDFVSNILHLSFYLRDHALYAFLLIDKIASTVH